MKKTIFITVLSIFLLLMLPSVPAIQYNTVITNSANNINSIPELIFRLKEKLSTTICPASLAVMVWSVIWFGLFLVSAGLTKDSPLLFTITSLGMQFLLAIGIYNIAKYYNIPTEPAWFTLDGWKQLDSDEKVMWIVKLVLAVIVLTLVTKVKKGNN